MLENTFQHGEKQIKIRNLFFSRTPRSITEIGDIIPLYHTQNGLRRSYQTPLTVRSYDTSEPVCFRL